MSGRILVTGADGFVGRAVVERLAQDGREAVAGARRQAEAEFWVRLPGLAADADFSDAVAGIDTVVHCAARAHVLREEAADPLAAFRGVNRDGTLALARAAASARVRRFVFLSSIGVHGAATHGTPFSPGDLPQPHSPYAVSKWEAEQGLATLAHETGLEVVVIRPPLVIGRDPKGNLGSLVSAMRRGLPLPLGAVTRNRRDPVSLNTLAGLVTRAIDHPDAPGAPLLVSDGAPVSTRGVIERLAALHRLRPRLMPMPPALLGAGLKLLGRASLAQQLLGDLEVDATDTCRRLGWSPPKERGS